MTGAVPDRRRTSDARLDDIATDIADLRTELRAFMTAQASTNTEFRDHVTASRGLGAVHEDQWSDLTREVADHGKRLREQEDWRTRLDTYGTVLKLTFGASLVGALVGILGLVNGLIAFGK